MKIHLTSFCFGNRIDGETATPGWASNVGHLDSIPGIYDFNKYQGLKEIVSGINEQSQTWDIGNLNYEKMSKNRIIEKFGIFDKLYVNHKLIPQASYILAIVSENTQSHKGRVSLSYPGYFEYHDKKISISNEKTLGLISNELCCQDGCWFIFDISLGANSELHFQAKVVSKDFIIYKSPVERKEHWKSLLNDFRQTIDEFKLFCKNVRGMKNESSVQEYVNTMPKVKSWFVQNDICDGAFEIWNLQNDISSIRNKLEGPLKEAWQKAAQKNVGGDNGFKMAAWNRWTEFVEWYFNNNKFSLNTADFRKKDFHKDCRNAGLHYSDSLLTRFIGSLLTKPFVILTGLSGSGKTKLAEAFAKWISNDSSQYCIVPVGADWTNRDPLLGYPNALDSKVYIKPDSGVIDLIIDANSNPQLPYFLILDEMNLSHVERYFADFLSVMESKDCINLYDEKVANENDVPSKIKLPENLFIIGTVNIDETTNMFSPKVLDRANTIEFRVDCNQMKEFLDATIGLDMRKLFQFDRDVGRGAILANQFTDLAKARNLSLSKTDRKKISVELLNFFTELTRVGAEFGFRSASEILLLINQIGLLDSSLSFETKIDIAIMQKLLPKLHGSRRKLSPILKTLGSFCIESEIDVVKDVFEDPNFDFFDEDRIKGNSSKRIKYPLSLEKLARMYRGAIDNGFASYAEA